MKKRILLIVVSCFLLIIDNTFSHFISIKDAVPSFLFVFSIAYSIINGRKEGIIIGVISGMLQDIYFTNCFGINSLLNLLICYVAASVGEGIWREKKIIPIVTIFLATIAKYLGIFIIFYALEINMNLFRGIYVALYNSVIMLFAYKTILKTFNRDDKRRGWRF